MRNDDPKIIFNFSIENSELEKKVRIAVDKYIENLTKEKIEDIVVKRVRARTEELLNDRYKGYYTVTIDGTYFEDYIHKKVDDKIREVIDNDIALILMEKMAKLLSTEKGEDSDGRE